MEIRSKVGEQLLEVRIVGTKISKGSSHEHSMRVKPKYVVVTWIQITSFDELQHIYIEIKKKKSSLISFQEETK